MVSLPDFRDPSTVPSAYRDPEVNVTSCGFGAGFGVTSPESRGNVRRQLCNNVTVAMGVDGAMSSDGQAVL